MCVRHTQTEAEVANRQGDDILTDLTHFPLLPTRGCDIASINIRNNRVIDQHTTDAATEMINDETREGNEWKKVPERRKKKENWRSKLNILKGTNADDTSGFHSTDIDLVAYGIRKDTTGIQVSQYLLSKGLQVKSCDLLTKYEGARSLAYKVTIKKSDFEKACSPDL